SAGAIIKSSTSVPQASKNGRWLVTYTDSKLIRIDLQKQNGDPYLFGDINGANRRAISDSGRYVAVFSIKNKNLALYDLNNCSDACNSVDLTAYLNQQVDSVQSIERMEFIDEHLLRLFVRQTETNTQPRTTQVILAPDGYSIP